MLKSKHTVGATDKISFDADVQGQIENLASNPHGDLQDAGGHEEDPILQADRLISGLPPEDHVVRASQEMMPRRRDTIRDMFTRRRP
jgi:hypothetical protein